MTAGRSLVRAQAFAHDGGSFRAAADREVWLSELAAEPLILLDLPHTREYFLHLLRLAGIEAGIGEDRDLGPGSVVVVTGGARGIGARVAIEMARTTGCGIELVGVPMQRNAALGTRNVLTEEEFKQAQERFARQAAQDEAEFDLDAATSTPGGGRSCSSTSRGRASTGWTMRSRTAGWRPSRFSARSWSSTSR